MAQWQRSPFGELVHTYRSALNLTQAELVQRIFEQSQQHDHLGPVSLRTLSSIESRRPPTDPWPGVFTATAEALAFTFGFEPGTSQWQHFMQLSRAIPPTTTEVEPSDPPPSADPPLADLPHFIPAGRLPHLSRLEKAIAATVRGESGLLLVQARAGTGKTTLIANALREAVETHPDLVVLWGACTDNDASTLEPFRQILTVMNDDPTSVSPQQALSQTNLHRIAQRHAVALNAIVTDGRGLIDRLLPADVLMAKLESRSLPAHLIASLAALLSNPTLHLDPSGVHEQTCRVLTSYAGAGPVVLVLEDLHWSEAPTAALLAHLARYFQHQSIPILIIGSYRPAEIASDSVFQALLTEFARYYDDALIDLSSAVGSDDGYAFTQAFIADCVEDPPQALIDTFYRITAGHPFFVRAMLNLYLTDGGLRTSENSQATWHHDPANLPTEINELFATQVQSLPENLVTILTAASVQGTIFSAEILQQVLGISRSDLMEQLDRQLIRPLDIVRSAGYTTISGKRQHRYEINHALFRNFLYHRISEVERERLHTAIALAYIDIFGTQHDEVSARVAVHFERAHHLDEAARYFHMAGDTALERHDYSRARDMFQRVQNLGEAVPDPFYRAQSLVGLGNCARGEGYPPLARDYFAQAIALATQKQLSHVRANAHTSIGMLEFDAGDMRQGAERLSQAVGILQEFGDLQEASRSLALLSHTLHGFGHYADAANRAREAISLATSLENDILLAGGIIALANCFLDIGVYDQAIEMYEQAMVISQESNHVHRVVLCRINLALCLIEKDALPEALAMLEPVFARQSEINRRLFNAAEFNAAIIHEAAGRIDLAHAHYQRSLDSRMQLDQAALAIDSHAGLIRLDLANGKLDAVLPRLDIINHRLQTHGVEGIEHYGRLHVTLAQAYTALEQPEQARQAIQQGISILTERVQLLANPPHRQAYLYNVPFHLALIRLGKVEGIAPPEPCWGSP